VRHIKGGWTTKHLAIAIIWMSMPLFAREKIDVIVMNNGDRLTCEIKQLDWPDLPEIRTCRDDLDSLQREGHLDRMADLSREAIKMTVAAGENMSGSAIYAAWIRYARKHRQRVFPVE